MSTGVNQHAKVKAQRTEELNVTLPEDLVERILSMVPFPHVFKARTLSKSWLARFSPISSQEDERKTRLATWFQKEAGERSADWKTLCPVFVLDCQQGFIAYDKTTDSWPQMPSLSFLPHNIIKRSKLQMEGSLLLVWEHDFDWETSRSLVVNMHVANFLTREWKQLPLPPHELNESLRFEKLLCQSSSEAYKVVVFYSGRGYYRAQMYDSKLSTWRSYKICVKDFLDLSRPTYFNGVLYMVVGQNPRNLLAFNVEEGTFEEIELLGDMMMGTYDVDLVICNSDLLMTVKRSVFGKTVQLLKIDLGARRLSELARGPPTALDVGELGTGSVCDKSWAGGRAASDGECIFFPMWDFHEGTVVYKVREDKWSHISFPGDRVGAHADMPKLEITCFQPNMNPFLAV